MEKITICWKHFRLNLTMFFEYQSIYLFGENQWIMLKWKEKLNLIFDQCTDWHQWTVHLTAWLTEHITWRKQKNSNVTDEKVCCLLVVSRTRTEGQLKPPRSWQKRSKSNTIEHLHIAQAKRDRVEKESL